MRYWLVKSEPDVFSFADLQAAPKKTTHWDGVRNYQARNTLRDEMKQGDRCFYYHSNAEPSGIAGICEVVREGYPDHTAFDKKDPHHDPKSKADAPTWYMVDVKAVKPFPRLIALGELREVAALKGMVLLQKGSRLSVQPVTKKEWETICAMAGVAG
ncbi:MAG: EVE domain-containing protein [Gemmatimonadota bacterium]|nr:EVE domain-containing protein [Gemmatimonadota bacterium]MDQ8170261.1 EVE domain-containing protein [Gemmatimonadota bacterium]MDQ8175719.1 EVE domain-containing protein [Gemmatimonadota bacterium]